MKNLILFSSISLSIVSCGSLEEPKSSNYVSPKKPASNSDSKRDSNPSKIKPTNSVVDNSKVEPVPTPGAEPDGKWHTVLLTGDNSISAFDNARESIASFIQTTGVLASDIFQMSMSSKKINGTTVKQTSTAQLETSLQGLGSRDRCLVHMTSHGSRTGFFLVNQGEISPSKLDSILTKTCGDRPTVLLISACYSGQFAASDAMRKPNRIILTAARPDRTSFGCGAEEKYTYWDSCLIESLPHANSWQSLHDATTACVTSKESQGSFTPSGPQLFIGDKVKDLPYVQ